MNIREILIDLTKKDDMSGYNKVANVILKNYNSGIFKNQTDLAKECFISESAITKFAQKLGFKGFREFNFNLKNEHNKYYSNQEKNTNLEKINLVNLFNDYHSYIESDMKFLEKLANQIKNKNKLLIIASYQNESGAEYTRDCLLELGIEVFYSSIRVVQDKILKKYINNTPTLVLLSGQDNTFMAESINYLINDDNKNNLFILSSESQHKKIKQYNEKFIIPYNMQRNSYKYRKLFIDYIILNLFELLV